MTANVNFFSLKFFSLILLQALADFYDIVTESSDDLFYISFNMLKNFFFLPSYLSFFSKWNISSHSCHRKVVSPQCPSEIENFTDNLKSNKTQILVFLIFLQNSFLNMSKLKHENFPTSVLGELQLIN